MQCLEDTTDPCQKKCRYYQATLNPSLMQPILFLVPFISVKFLIVLSLDPQILDLFLSLFPRINCLRGSLLKGSSTILSVNGDSFLLGRLSSFVMLLPVSSPQAPGHHLSCAGGVQDLVELPREGYLRSNLFHMRLI